jgi:hypothetical protein
MPLPRVTGVVWWKMGISHYKAIFGRAPADEGSRGYTKDFLQAPRAIGQAFREMFGGGDPPYEPLTYVWPGGRFEGGKIYPASDYAQNGRLEVGQWTRQRAPHPWRVGDPAGDPLITLPGDADAAIPDEADEQWEDLEELAPWLMMVQLDNNRSELHLRAYLAAPPVDLVDADLARVPETVRLQMTGQGGMVADLPDIWFDPDDLRDPWRLTPEDGGREAERAARVAEVKPGVTPGVEYRAANENPTSAAPEPFDIDPNERDRATRAHAVTQNALAEAVRARGREPLSPRGEPNYDLAWEETDGAVIVAEIKSITARNEERQLRLGLGQILRYCDLVEAGGRKARGVLVTSSEPSDERWVSLCGQLGVGLIWPPDLDAALDAWLAGSDE